MQITTPNHAHVCGCRWFFISHR